MLISQKIISTAESLYKFGQDAVSSNAGQSVIKYSSKGLEAIANASSYALDKGSDLGKVVVHYGSKSAQVVGRAGEYVLDKAASLDTKLGVSEKGKDVLKQVAEKSSETAVLLYEKTADVSKDIFVGFNRLSLKGQSFSAGVVITGLASAYLGLNYALGKGRSLKGRVAGSLVGLTGIGLVAMEGIGLAKIGAEESRVDIYRN